MSNVEKLLEELRSRPETEGLLRECGDSDHAEALLSVAERLGIETTVDAEEIRAFVKEVEALRRASTDQAIEEVAELGDDDLEAVAGGYEPGTSINCKGNRWDDFLACKMDNLCTLTWNCPDFML